MRDVFPISSSPTIDDAQAPTWQWPSELSSPVLGNASLPAGVGLGLPPSLFAHDEMQQKHESTASTPPNAPRSPRPWSRLSPSEPQSAGSQGSIRSLGSAQRSSFASESMRAASQRLRQMPEQPLAPSALKPRSGGHRLASGSPVRLGGPALSPPQRPMPLKDMPPSAVISRRIDATATPQLGTSRLWDAARARLAGSTALPSYQPGEAICGEEEDGARYTLSRQMKLRKVQCSLLHPVRIGTALLADKRTNLLSALIDHGKLMPLKINRYNEVVDGNHRFDVAMTLGLAEVWVVLDETWPTPELDRIR